MNITRTLHAAFFSAALAFATSAHAQISILTQNNDNGRDAVYNTETAITPTSVQSSAFKKLFTVHVDNLVHGQALILAGTPNIMVLFTSANGANGGNSSLWGFDADTGAQLWQHSFGSISPNNTGNPVIDPAAGTNGAVYVLTKSSSTQLHAIDPTTGNELPGSPVSISASGFSTGQNNQRAAMLLSGGVVYISFAHQYDTGGYHGFVMGYRYTGSGFTQTGVFNDTPSGNQGGIWQGGDGLIADSSGNIFTETGNGSFNANTGGSNYGMSVVKLSASGLGVLDWFTPSDESGHSSADADLNGGGMVLIPGTTRLFLGPTKYGAMILVNSANLGHFSSGGIQTFGGFNSAVAKSPIAWNSGTGSIFAYVWPSGSAIKQFSYNSGTGMFSPAGVYKNSTFSAGGSLAVSSAPNGSNAILWAVGGSEVHAMNPLDVSQPDYWNSNMHTGDSLGSTGEYQFPAIANGKVYVPTASSTVVVYGGSSGNPAAEAPTFTPGSGTYSSAQSVTMSTATTGATIHYTTDGSTPTCSSGTVYTGAVNVSSTTTFKAIACAPGFDPSPVVTASYVIQTGGTITLQASNLSPTGSGQTITSTNDANAPGGTWVKISSTAVGQFIQFTTPTIAAGTYQLSFSYRSNPTRAQHNLVIDGTTQVGGTVDQYASTFSYPPAVLMGNVTFATSTTHTIKLNVTGHNAASSSYDVSAVQFILVPTTSNQVHTPTFSPLGGTYTNAQSVTISDSTAGASINYTTDGTTPSQSNGTPYTGPVTISTTTTLQAMAFESGMTDSNVGSATYTISTGSPITLQASSLSPTGSGQTITSTNDTSAPGGTWVKIASTAVGQFIKFTTPSIAAGNYQLTLIYRTNPTRGIHDITIDGNPCGSTIDQYAPSPSSYITAPSCPVSFATAGTHVIQLDTTGKNASSTSYEISAVQFIFTPQ